LKIYALPPGSAMPLEYFNGSFTPGPVLHGNRLGMRQRHSTAGARLSVAQCVGGPVQCWFPARWRLTPQFEANMIDWRSVSGRSSVRRYKRSAIAFSRILMDDAVPFFEYPVCRYKRLTIAFGPKFYWTRTSYWSSIEVAKVHQFMNRGANHHRRQAHRIAGPSAHDLKEEAS
jgi:hypothetical protein